MEVEVRDDPGSKDDSRSNFNQIVQIRSCLNITVGHVSVG